MARARAADYGEKQRLIRDRAAALFAARGFAATSIADIAAACGTAKSLVYHYFAAKDDILYDLLRDHVERLVAAAEAALARTAGARERLRAFVRAEIVLYAGARDRHRLLLGALGDLPAARRDEIKALERRLVDLVRALCADLNPALAHDRALATATAMSVLGLINWTHTWYRADGPLDPAAYADLAAAILLDGVTRATPAAARAAS
jgi:AcrR family transcriptional regulator